MTPPSPGSQRAANRRGVLAMSAAMASFIVNDSLVKFVSESMPGPQLIFIRSVCASLLVLGIVIAVRRRAESDEDIEDLEDLGATEEHDQNC